VSAQAHARPPMPEPMTIASNLTASVFTVPTKHTSGERMQDRSTTYTHGPLAFAFSCTCCDQRAHDVEETPRVAGNTSKH
jgi:hypothetical protein